VGEWITATKPPNTGKEFWRPSFAGEWPADEPHPSTPLALREPLPPPCGRCGGRLWRWVSDDSTAVSYRHGRALRAWRALGSPGQEPQPERVVSWLAYRFEHFTDCGSYTHGPSMIEPLRPMRSVGD
jgi:hypothetical protein